MKIARAGRSHDSGWTVPVIGNGDGLHRARNVNAAHRVSLQDLAIVSALQ
jgi:hypothetical protein